MFVSNEALTHIVSNIALPGRPFARPSADFLAER